MTAGDGENRVQLSDFPHADPLLHRLGSDGDFQGAVAAAGVAPVQNHAFLFHFRIRSCHVLCHRPRQRQPEAQQVLTSFQGPLL